VVLPYSAGAASTSEDVCYPRSTATWPYERQHHGFGGHQLKASNFCPSLMSQGIHGEFVIPDGMETIEESENLILLEILFHILFHTASPVSESK
jgi:hypothetical protein